MEGGRECNLRQPYALSKRVVNKLRAKDPQAFSARTHELFSALQTGEILKISVL
jgi:hypothetical protein